MVYYRKEIRKCREACPGGDLKAILKGQSDQSDKRAAGK
jgi:hypothetical protein